MFLPYFPNLISVGKDSRDLGKTPLSPLPFAWQGIYLFINWRNYTFFREQSKLQTQRALHSVKKYSLRKSATFCTSPPEPVAVGSEEWISPAAFFSPPSHDKAHSFASLASRTDLIKPQQRRGEERARKETALLSPLPLFPPISAKKGENLFAPLFPSGHSFPLPKKGEVCTEKSPLLIEGRKRSFRFGLLN